MGQSPLATVTGLNMKKQFLLLVFLWVSIPMSVFAQDVPDDEIKLSFGRDVELKTLVEFVSSNLDIKILYQTQELQNKRINIKSAGSIKKSALLGVLQSALQKHDLLIVDDAVKGWKSIVKTSDLILDSQPGTAAEQEKKFGAPTAVTQTFFLQHISPRTLEPVIRPFLAQGASNNLIVLEEQKAIVVSAYTPYLEKIARLIKQIDLPGPEVNRHFLEVSNLKAEDLAAQLTEILTSRGAAAAGQAANQPTAPVLRPLPRTNQILIIGNQETIKDVIRLADSLDVSIGKESRYYNFRNIPAQQIDQLFRSLLGEQDTELLFDSVVDERNNVMIVNTTVEIHQRLEEFQKRLDVGEGQRRPSPVKFYKLKNISALEAITTIRAVEGVTDGTSTVTRSRDFNSNSFRGGGINFAPIPFNQLTQPAFNQSLNPLANPLANQALGAAGGPQVGAGSQTNGQVPGLPAGGTEDSRETPNAPALGQGARVTVDENTNSLIVVADEATQKIYEELIKSIDNRRPQVIIEAKIVTIDTSDNFSLGVEVSGGDTVGANQLFGFSSFGLSAVDAATGALSLTPGLGFNGTLIDPEIADVVVQALSTHARAKVVSTPRILVNENAEGLITSTISEPFANVNLSDSGTFTGLGGTQDAGTSISVVPNISEGDHLRLDFSLEVSSFTGGGDGTLPPPRQVSSIQSVVTIPDGHTVIVGGLTTQSASDSISGIPLLERIPIIRELSSSRSNADINTALFVFIRPIILRDDKFKDLKYISKQSVSSAGIKPDVPQSYPVLMR